MQIIKQKVELLTPLSKNVLKLLEAAGRTCYKSEDKITNVSAPKFVKMLKKRHHLSVLEHINITFRLTVNRAIQQELTRHRIASYSIESTRYINYSKESGLKFIMPLGLDGTHMGEYMEISFLESENDYNTLISKGIKPEVARDILPLATASEVVMTMNIRGWLEMLPKRLDKSAHPQIREVAEMIYKKLNKELPEIFD